MVQWISLAVSVVSLIVMLFYVLPTLEALDPRKSPAMLTQADKDE